MRNMDVGQDTQGNVSGDSCENACLNTWYKALCSIVTIMN